MPYKDKEKQKEYQRNWIRGRYEQFKPNRSAIRERNAQYVKNLKESSPCTDCRQFYPYYVMQYDHLGYEVKLNHVGTMASENYSIAKIQSEIDKCELVCANCHAVRTHIRRGKPIGDGNALEKRRA